MAVASSDISRPLRPAPPPVPSSASERRGQTAEAPRAAADRPSGCGSSAAGRRDHRPGPRGRARRPRPGTGARNAHRCRRRRGRARPTKRTGLGDCFRQPVAISKPATADARTVAAPHPGGAGLARRVRGGQIDNSDTAGRAATESGRPARRRSWLSSDCTPIGDQRIDDSAPRHPAGAGPDSRSRAARPRWTRRRAEWLIRSGGCRFGAVRIAFGLTTTVSEEFG